MLGEDFQWLNGHKPEQIEVSISILTALHVVKTLGVIWRSVEDVFTFHCTLIMPKEYTRHAVLSKIAIIFSSKRSN